MQPFERSAAVPAVVRVSPPAPAPVIPAAVQSRVVTEPDAIVAPATPPVAPAAASIPPAATVPVASPVGPVATVAEIGAVAHGVANIGAVADTGSVSSYRSKPICALGATEPGAASKFSGPRADHALRCASQARSSAAGDAPRSLPAGLDVARTKHPLRPLRRRTRPRPARAERGSWTGYPARATAERCSARPAADRCPCPNVGPRPGKIPRRQARSRPSCCAAGLTGRPAWSTRTCGHSRPAHATV